MSERRDELETHLDSVDLGGDAVFGRLDRVRRGASSVVSFAFARDWLTRRPSLVIDPSLGLYEGDQYVEGGRLPAVFSDTAPDRWGRTLMQRREATNARREERRPRTLDDWDFLVGVSDALRMGAIRLRNEAANAYVSDEVVSVPPIARLRQLQYYAQRAERGQRLDPKDEDKEIALLIAPGSSLGGTRPKANVRAEDGSLWIAKFPAANDGWDVAAWEALIIRLASQAGISVPEVSTVRVGDGFHTFLARRFDRVADGRRAYASAMTLTGKQDGEPASYLDIAEAITRFGGRQAIAGELEQMFRRVVFNVLVGNRDDHLRNHGFLGMPDGWRLSPVFDVNPAPGMVEHALKVDAETSSPDLDVVRRTGRYFRLVDASAARIIGEVRSAVAGWRDAARVIGISRDEIDLMTAVFAV